MLSFYDSLVKQSNSHIMAVFSELFLLLFTTSMIKYILNV